MGSKVKDIVNKYKDVVDIGFVNQIIEQSGELNDFEMNKSTIMNISEWALNGKSDDEIRQSLSLSKKQWDVLVHICPVLLLVMRDSRAMADMVIAGSLFQTAIGGKRIKRQVAKSVKEYDENGRVCGEHLETIELEEELPPNPILLKFLAENKLSEKFGGKKSDNNSEFAKILDEMTPEQIALIEQAQKGGALDD